MSPPAVDNKRAVIGFTILGNGKWAGGLNYLRTVLELIATDFSDRFSARLLIWPGQEKLADETFAGVLEVPPIVDAAVAGAGVGKRAAEALLIGSDRAFARLVETNGIDLMFESAQFFGNRFLVPVLSWIPDFQHRHLPHLFSRAAWWKRDIGFRAQTSGRRTILLSSGSAEVDCLRFYPSSRGKTQVARFTGAVDLDAVLAAAQSVGARHNLPERFVFLPNQFWRHKNHELVVDALAELKQAGRREPPTVVMTGSTTDPRDPELFDRVMGIAASAGVDSWFRHLGMVPFSDVLALNAAADAVINPSRFEGWASSVEEAKSLGSPLLLSDIPPHREQAPTAHFFGCDDPKGLAEILDNVAAAPQARRPSPDVLAAANTARRAEFATQFGQAIEAALQR